MCKLIASATWVVALFVVTLPAHALTPAHLWSERFGSTGDDVAYTVAIDASGNMFVTGSFWGTVAFGGGNLVSAGGYDVFLAKYNSSGVHQWSQRFGSTGPDYAYALAVDGSGNVIITGTFAGTVNFGGSNLVSAGGSDIFLAKYNSSGVHQWSQRFGNALEDDVSSVAADGSGNVAITGPFGGTINFGGSNLVSAGSGDIFLARYNASGAHQWSQRLGGTGADGGMSVTLDGFGSVFVTGYFSGTADFGGGNLVSAGDYDVFVAKYSTNGVHQLSWRSGSTGFDVGDCIDVDASGNIVVAGRFSGTVDFGGGNLVSAGGIDLFLAKYNWTGAHQWSRRLGSTMNDAISSTVDDSGNVVITGAFWLTADFGGGNLVSAGGTDIFLAKYNPAGTHVWSQRLGNTGVDWGHSAAVDASGKVVVTGLFMGTVDFGGGNLVSAGNYDIFLARYTGVHREPAITSIADIGNDQGRQLKIRFDRSGLDDLDAPGPVKRYVAFRRDDPPPATTLHVGAAARLESGWTQVGSVDAFTNDNYGIDVPTIADSTIALGQYYSYFFVRAATDVPATYYDSPVDSGYSLDNLAPGVPTNFAYNSGSLSWDESTAEDFDYFTVYGSNTDSFGSATVVDYSVAPSMDVSGSPYVFYFITATDFSGNEGRPARVNTLSGAGGTPKNYVLSVTNYPNPFNPGTTVKYTVPSQGRVTITVYDPRGAHVATLFQGERAAGAYDVEWDGRTGTGAVVSSGVYFARIEHAGGSRSRKMVLLK